MISVIAIYSLIQAHDTVSLPLFDTVEVTEQEDGTTVGYIYEEHIGPLKIIQATITRDKDRMTLNGEALLHKARCGIHLESQKEDAGIDTYTVYRGTLQSTSATKPEICGVPLDGASIVTNPRTDILEITSTTSYLSLPLEVTFTARLQENASLYVAAQVGLLSQPWKPFANTALPAKLQETGITNIHATLKAGTTVAPDHNTQLDVDDIAAHHESLFGALEITGETQILNIPAEITGEIGTSGGEPGVAFVVHVPDDWHIFDSFPEIQSSSLAHIFSNFTFHNARFVMTSYSEYTIFDNLYSRGFHIESALSWDPDTDHPFLHRLNNLFSQNSEKSPHAFMKGSWDGESLEGLSLKTGISSGKYGFDLGPVTFFDLSPFLELNGAPSITLAGGCKMRPTPEDKPVDLYLAMTTTPEDVAFSSSMRGTWHNPFGTKGIAIRNLAVKGAQSFDALAEAPATAGIAALIPSQAGISGEGDITLPDNTQASFDVKGNIGKRMTSLALRGFLKSSISSDSFIQFLLQQAGLPHHGIHVPHIQVEQAHIHFVPLGTYIGQVRVEQGIGASCYITIGSKRAYIDIGASLSEGGLHLYGQCPRIDIGPVHITGSDGNDGPKIDTQLNVNKQHLHVDGRIKIGDLFDNHHDVYINRNGLYFNFSNQIGPLSLDVTGQSEQINKKLHDMTLTIHFTNTTTSYLRHLLSYIFHLQRKHMIGQCSESDDDDEAYTRAPEKASRICLPFMHGLSIDDIYFHGSARELVHGTLPYVHVCAHIFGNPIEFDVQVSFKHPYYTVRRIAHALIKKVTKEMHRQRSSNIA